MIKIDFSCLPVWTDGRNKGKTKWIDTPGCVVCFETDNIAGEIEIVEYNPKSRDLKVCYLENYYFIRTNHFLEGHIYDIINNRTGDYKLEIGEKIIDANRNLVIIDRSKKERISNGVKRTDKCYRYHCNKCGYDCDGGYDRRTRKHIPDYWTTESNLIRGKSGCACCSNPAHVVVPNINSIGHTNPEIIPFLVNKQDALMFTHRSEERVYVQCPDCGRKRNGPIRIADLVKNHSIDCPCGDKISFPEKVMYYFLSTFSVDFVFQMTKKILEWCNEYRYDFYFEIDGKGYIVETHGIQHYEEQKRGRTLKEEQENDSAKKENALENGGISEAQYIVVDCRISQVEYIKQSISKSGLSKLFDISQVDWVTIQKEANCNFLKMACSIKKEKPMMSAADIGKEMRLSSKTIREYLKEGERLGWCEYNPNLERIRGNEKSSKMNRQNLSRKVEMFSQTGETLGVYESAMELEEESVSSFGVRLVKSRIQAACRVGKSYKGFYFKYTQ